jgi:cytidylate kinase
MLAMETNIQIAIDGPAGSGKSTIAKAIAAHLQFTHIDTGAMYRAVTLHAMEQGIDLSNPEAYGFLSSIHVRFTNNKIYLNDVDVTTKIHRPEVSERVSTVAALKVVRDYMVQIQQTAAAHGRIIMDGRDIGTVVLPNALIKIFLSASVEERARRRLSDYHDQGIQMDMATLMDDINKRDHIDSTRNINPLRKADDAVSFDTTNTSIEESVTQLIQLIRQRGKEHGYQL